MRGVFLVFPAIALGACFNVTSPNDPPPHVDPPVVACTMPVEASDASCVAADASDDAAALVTGCDAGPPVQQYGECMMPPSVCADSHWAAYFDDGTCVNGKCELVTKYHYCETGCTGGRCISTGSTAAGRGF
jgi:hypothetical protein